MEKYYHNYKGIVLQNDDPEMMGRVKVWVPEINMTLYKEWNEDRDNDKKFTELGGNIGSALNPGILLRLKNALPWADVKQPIFGMGTATTYHADKDFAEIADDADNSVQHAVINKLPPPPGSPPPTSNPKAIQAAMAATGAAPAPPNSSSQINNFSNPNPSSTALDYVRNSVAAPATPAPSTSLGTPPLPTGDNIAQMVITFTPNARNARNTHRRFTTNAQICDSTGCLDGNASALGQFSSFSNTFVTPAGTLSASYSPPINYIPSSMYSPAPIAPLATTTPTPNIVRDTFLSVTGNATTQPTARVSTSAGDFVQVTFVPNSRNYRNTHRRFTTSASLISYSIGSNNISISGMNENINVNDINDITIVYDQEGVPVNLNSERLGQLAGLTGQYSNNASVGIPASPISPPSTVSVPKPNRGGGGGELFRLAYSSLMPFMTLLNTLVGNTNISSKQSKNYGTPPDKVTDPHKTKGDNQQTSASCQPPMRSPTQSNKVKGMVSIPAVGAHVSVYFQGGDPLYPIVDGVFYSQEGFAGLHDVSGEIPA